MENNVRVAPLLCVRMHMSVREYIVSFTFLLSFFTLSLSLCLTHKHTYSLSLSLSPYSKHEVELWSCAVPSVTQRLQSRFVHSSLLSFSDYLLPQQLWSMQAAFKQQTSWVICRSRLTWILNQQTSFELSSKYIYTCCISKQLFEYYFWNERNSSVAHDERVR